MMVFAGIFVIVVGILNIFAKDFVWELTAFGNRLDGKASERTDTWKIGTTLMGIGLVVVGVFIMLAHLDFVW
jgi:hypothetical protein